MTVDRHDSENVDSLTASTSIARVESSNELCATPACLRSMLARLEDPALVNAVQPGLRSSWSPICCHLVLSVGTRARSHLSSRCVGVFSEAREPSHESPHVARSQRRENTKRSRRFFFPWKRGICKQQILLGFWKRYRLAL